MIQLPSVALFTNYSGGVYVFTARLAEALQKIGHEVHIVSYQTESESDEERLEILTKTGALPRLIPHANCSSDDLKQIAKAFRETESSLLIPNFRGVAFGACAMLSRTQNIRTIAICHSDHSSYHNLFRRYDSIVDKYVIPVSSSAQNLGELLPQRNSDIVPIGHGIPESETCEDFSGNTLHLSYHGRVCEEQKHIFRFIDLSLQLKQREIPHKIFILGEGSEYPELLKRIEENGLNDYFAVRPYVTSYADMMGLVRTCHIEILTSEHEGFCLGLAESMGIGLPGVAMECGGVLDEYLHSGENGFIVPQGNVEEMANKIAMLQKNPEMWKKMSEAARHEIQSRYSMELFGKKYSDLLVQLVASDEPFRHWSAIRPVIVTEESLRSRVVEKIGQKLRFW